MGACEVRQMVDVVFGSSIRAHFPGVLPQYLIVVYSCLYCGNPPVYDQVGAIEGALPPV